MRRHSGVQLIDLRRKLHLGATLAAMLIAACVVLLAPSAASAQNGKRTTVIVVRHAEKAAEPAADPPLTDVGRARAEALWLALKDAGVQAVITTQLTRTIETGAPTVNALRLKPEVVQTVGADHAARVASLIKAKHAGETVLVVGHSNTVPAIIAALGAKEPAPICDEAYDNLYVVTIDETGRASLIHSRYGAATPVGAACGAMK